MKLEKELNYIAMPSSRNSNLTKFYYVYVLESIRKLNKLYTGYAEDLKERLKQHNKELVTSTRPFRPWKLIYYEACLNKQDAKRREKYLKTTQGRRLLKRRLKEYLYS